METSISLNVQSMLINVTCHSNELFYCHSALLRPVTVLMRNFKNELFIQQNWKNEAFCSHRK